MSTATQAKQYDRGYEDAIEGRGERETSPHYVKGYKAGREFAADLPTEAEINMQQRRYEMLFGFSEND